MPRQSDNDELEEMGVKTPHPHFWCWVMCWPLALWISITTAWSNAKTGPDGS